MEKWRGKIFGRDKILREMSKEVDSKEAITDLPESYQLKTPVLLLIV